uniref:Immunoglobulin E-set n=1 Tax=Syphacia muris TaxID=451379 RepID=A0A0N5AAW7_9BILA
MSVNLSAICFGAPREKNCPFEAVDKPATNTMGITTTTAGGSSSSSKDLVDLEQIVLNWAKQIFEITKTKAESRIHKKHLQFNINWSHLLNECLDPTYTYGGVSTNAVNQAKEEQCLFKSTFSNTTDREQEYSFKTERSTRSSATVIVEKGLCRGVDMSLKLKTPCEVVEANAGFHNEISITHVGENTTEEELIWGIDSNVRVPPRCEAVAELVILEDRQVRNFKVESRLSGRIIVTVTNLYDNNSLVTIIEGNIADIIRGNPNHPTMGFTVHDDVSSFVASAVFKENFPGQKQLVTSGDTLCHLKSVLHIRFFISHFKVVTFIATGVCKFKYGVEQKVRITEKPLRPR